MTNEQVKADIAANLPDNTSGLITPAKLRTEMGKTVDYSDTSAAASTAAHNADAGAHLNIVRRSITANLVLTAADFPNQRIASDAARDVALPAESTAAWQFLLANSGATYTLTIKRAGGTAVGGIIPGGMLLVEWDGAAFRSF